jgi:hypothetical protein
MCSALMPEKYVDSNSYIPKSTIFQRRELRVTGWRVQGTSSLEIMAKLHIQPSPTILRPCREFFNPFSLKYSMQRMLVIRMA